MEFLDSLGVRNGNIEDKKEKEGEDNGEEEEKRKAQTHYTAAKMTPTVHECSILLLDDGTKMRVDYQSM